MANFLISDGVYIGTSSACIIDTIPPVFSGINFLDVETRGQIRAGWPAATDSTPPIRYEVYIRASTATGLFSTSNIIASTDKFQFDIFNLPDGSFLQNGTTYFVGIRAVDAVGNRDSNTVSLSVISTGILTAIDVYSCDGVFSTDSSNQFRGTFWATKNSSLAFAPGAVMGTGSYQVYDKDGNAIVGMSGTGISANSQGQYVITAIPSLLTEALNHYVVKLTVSVDGEARVSNVGLGTEKPVYQIDGISYLDNTNSVTGSFWVSQDEKLVTSSLGTGSYQLYSSGGLLISGISESGIVAGVDGIYKITPFALPGSLDPAASYTVLVTLTVNGTTKQDFITIKSQQQDYGVRAQFSINAGNQFQGTFWGIKGGVRAGVSILGTAAYQVYDKDGTIVPGLSESGLVADSNGLFKTTPVSAVPLTDLTHYTVKITMSIGGANRIDFKGFTLLGN